MRSLNLIDVSVSDIQYTLRHFPDGQPHIKLLLHDALDGAVNLYTRMSNPDDFLLALYATQALRDSGATDVSLFISYLTTARMDRNLSFGEAFSLKVTAHLINCMEYRKVCIFDPHSAVTMELIERGIAISNEQFAADVLKDFLEKNTSVQVENVVLVAPDKGAVQKISRVAAFMGNIQVITSQKVRDAESGKLLHFEVHANDLTGKTCLILDDILDSGGTFTGVADILKQKGATGIIAAVSHGVFSKGYDLPYVTHIYTTDSFQTHERAPDTVTVLPVMKYLDSGD